MGSLAAAAVTAGATVGMAVPVEAAAVVLVLVARWVAVWEGKRAVEEGREVCQWR